MYWAHANSMVALPFIGTVHHRFLAPWLDWNKAALLGPAPGCASPRQADLLVVVGHISQKLGPILQRLHGRMASPSFVLQIACANTPRIGSYATIADVSQIIPVDVIINGAPPSEENLSAGLEILTQRIREVRHEGQR
jgi:NADH-quinone oxidoreductase subunit B